MFKLITSCVLLTTVWAVEFQITNREIGAIWVGIQGNSGKPALANGGFVLEAGASTSVHSPADWAGRFWARTWCDYNSKHCLTGDCGNRLECGGNGGAPPATLAEITLKGWGGKDYYDISLVDGFNLAASMEPVGGQGDGSQYSCKRTACARHLNNECPNELKLNTNNGVVGCKSACLAFNNDQYCCRGAFNRPETCRSNTWPVDYPNFFKSRCPDAYSYAYDDHKRYWKYLVCKQWYPVFIQHKMVVGVGEKGLLPEITMNISDIKGALIKSFADVIKKLWRSRQYH